MSAPLRDWPEAFDALYRAARTMWPDLTYSEFVAAAEAWMDRQPSDQLGIRDTANGVEAELRARFGAPIEEDA